MRRLVKTASLFVALMIASAPALALELLMLEQPGCYWCAQFNKEIAPAYANTEEGKRAPLRRIDITQAWPADLPKVRVERYTPTFILVEDGRELDRIRGYPGDNWFWSLLGEMLKKHGNPGTSG